MSDDFKPADAFDVSDENPQVLSRSVRNLQTEMRTGFELLNQRLLPLLERLESKLDDLTVRVNRVERDLVDQDKRLSALERAAKSVRTARRK